MAKFIIDWSHIRPEQTLCIQELCVNKSIQYYKIYDVIFNDFRLREYEKNTAVFHKQTLLVI